VWFEDHQLTELAHHGLRALKMVEGEFPDTRSVKADRPERQCPNCGTPLFAFHFKHTPDVSLDGCRSCKGIWVDHEDLVALELQLAPRQAPAAKAAPSAPAAPKARRFRDQVSCPQCHELNARANLTCWRCRAALQPGALEVAADAAVKVRSCPACGEPLAGEFRAGVALLHCASCGGNWMKEETYQELMLTDRHKFGALEPDLPPGEPVDASQESRCPFCPSHLWPDEMVVMVHGTASFVSGVVTHTCPSCNGLWFKAGDIKRLYDGMIQYEAKIIAGR